MAGVTPCYVLLSNESTFLGIAALVERRRQRIEGQRQARPEGCGTREIGSLHDEIGVSAEFTNLHGLFRLYMNRQQNGDREKDKERVNAMERKNAGRQKTLFHMLLESYLKKWDDPTCRPRIGM